MGKSCSVPPRKASRVTRVEYDPGKQPTQEISDVEPVNSPPFPASHAVHDVELVSLAYVLGSQSVHVTDPVVLLAFPKAHTKHVLEEVADVEEL